MAIVTSYFSGETYGLLGPQAAATIIEDNTPYECIVIAISREDNTALVKRVITDYFGADRPIIGFSYLSGREDLFSFAKELKQEGALTILAGPQADVDYLGERDRGNHQHRFQGFWSILAYDSTAPENRPFTFSTTFIIKDGPPLLDCFTSKQAIS
ncbi:MAG: hypothetical protein ACOC6E_01450 [Thermodesulfobacteriota bacterium]